ncbi:MAG: ribosome silencing factor [Trueperaceae bacterium]
MTTEPTPSGRHAVASAADEHATEPQAAAAAKESGTTATPATSAVDIAGSVPDDVQLIVDALDDKRAADIAVLDLRSVSETLDWFVVATGESSLQLKALEDSVRERMKAHGYLPRGVEGPSVRWVLLDYGVVVVHVMSPEAREFYDLEGLWADAERIDVTPRQ